MKEPTLEDELSKMIDNMGPEEVEGVMDEFAAEEDATKFMFDSRKMPLRKPPRSEPPDRPHSVL